MDPDVLRSKGRLAGPCKHLGVSGWWLVGWWLLSLGIFFIWVSVVVEVVVVVVVHILYIYNTPLFWVHLPHLFVTSTGFFY